MKSEKGASLIELVMAFGLMGVMMLATASMFDANLKQIKFLEAKLEQTSFLSFAQLNFTKPADCIANFADITINPGSMVAGQKITLAKDKLRLAGGTLANYPMQALRLGDASFTVSSTTTGSDATGKLEFQFDPPPGVEMAKIKGAGFPMFLQVDAAGKVISCPGPSAAPNAVTGGLAPIAQTQSGNYYVTFPVGKFTTIPIVTITPLWTKLSGDEDTAWWFTELTTDGFRLNWAGPKKGGYYGSEGVMWRADAAE